MKNIRQFKYEYDKYGNLVFRSGLAKDANPILVGEKALNDFEKSVIPEPVAVMQNQSDIVSDQNTGVIQESVFIRPESVVADSGVLSPSIEEVPVVVAQEAIVQEPVINQARPDFQTIEISVPGMEVDKGMAVDNSLNVSDDQTIAQAIDAQLTSVAAVMEPTNIGTEPEQKLYTPAEFTAGTEVAKEEMPEVKSVVEKNPPDFVGMAVDIEQTRATVKSELEAILKDVQGLEKSIADKYTLLMKDLDAKYDNLSRTTALAKEAYDRRNSEYAAIANAVSAGISSLNTNNMDQNIVR